MPVGRIRHLNAAVPPGIACLGALLALLLTTSCVSYGLDDGSPAAVHVPVPSHGEKPDAVVSTVSAGEQTGAPTELQTKLQKGRSSNGQQTPSAAQLTQAIQRGGAWLAARQRTRRIDPVSAHVTPLLASALSLWSTAATPPDTFPRQRQLQLVGYCCRYRGPDGSFGGSLTAAKAGPSTLGGDPWVTGVLARAFALIGTREESHQMQQFGDRAAKYVARLHPPQPPKSTPIEIQGDSEEERRAAAFLAKVGKAPEPEIVPAARPWLFSDLAARRVDWPDIVSDACAAFKDDRLDAARLAARFQECHQEAPSCAGDRLFELAALARVLATHGTPTIDDVHGKPRSWSTEIRSEIIRSQNQDGSWGSTQPTLQTAWALLALNDCKQAEEGAGAPLQRN